MKNILVTGGCGFIGSNFVKKIIEDDYYPIILDSLTYAGNKNNLKNIDTNSYTFIKGDICDKLILNTIFEKGL